MFKTLWVVIFIKWKRFILLKRFFPDPDLGNSRILSRAKLSDKARDWLQLPASQQESFRALEHFVKSLACVNDSSERKIKLIQDYVLSAKSEEKRQNILFSAHQNRTILKYDEMTKEIMTCYFNGQQCCIQGRAKVHYPPLSPLRGGGVTPSSGTNVFTNFSSIFVTLKGAEWPPNFYPPPPDENSLYTTIWKKFDETDNL